MMTRVLAAVMMLLVGVAAEAASLRSRVVVDAPVVTLGDLLTEAGPGAEAVVAEAPPPGGRLILGAGRVAAIARAHGLALPPGLGPDRVLVERASQVVGAAEIAERIAEALAEEHPGARYRVTLSNRALALHLPPEAPTSIAVAALAFDPQSGRIEATVVGAAGSEAETRLRVSARARRVVAVPVLAHRLARDAVIAAEDLAWIDVPADRLGAAIVTDETELIGRVQRRPLRPGRPIRARDVTLPRLVKKGDPVVLSLLTPFMSLTMTGRALEDGAKGETVRVLNTTSKRVIEAVVAGFNQAVVATPGTLLAAR